MGPGVAHEINQISHEIEQLNHKRGKKLAQKHLSKKKRTANAHKHFIPLVLSENDA